MCHTCSPRGCLPRTAASPAAQLPVCPPAQRLGAALHPAVRAQAAAHKRLAGRAAAPAAVHLAGAPAAAVAAWQAGARQVGAPPLGTACCACCVAAQAFGQRRRPSWPAAGLWRPPSQDVPPCLPLLWPSTGAPHLHPHRGPACRAARLGALGIQPSRSQKSWQQRIASLDRLVDALGFPAAYALLLLTPASSAPRMAAQAVSCVASSGGGASRGNGLASEGGGGADMSEPRAPVLGGPQRPSGAGLTAREAAEVVQWHRRLRAGAMPAALAQALAARGLQALR